MTTTAQRLPWFDLWRAGYGSATVEVFKAGTSTLAAVYSDVDLTAAADNPFVLQSKTVNGIVYGKAAAPVYVNEPVEVHINSIDQTGIVRPGLVSLQDENADNAIAKTRRGTEYRRLIDRFDDMIRVRDFGALSSTESAVNTAILNRAIGAASGQSGGYVMIPAGIWPFTKVTLTGGVVLVGEARDATTLQSQEGEAVVTLSGDRSGLMDMTLDGVNLVADSIGVAAEDIDRSIMHRVLIKRFNTNIRMRGGRNSDWQDLSLDNGVDGALLLGDTTTGAAGDTWENNRWIGGEVSNHTNIAVSLSYEDAFVRNNLIQNVAFNENDTAVSINGARYSSFRGCRWNGNSRNFDVDDDSDTSKSDENTVIGLFVEGGEIVDGENAMDGACQDVIFEKMRLGNIDWILSLPDNIILLRDVTEGSGGSISGDGTKLQRWRSTLRGEIVGVTTDANPLTAWDYELAPGEVVYAVAKVVVRQRDGEGRAVYHVAAGAYREGSELDYDNQTANFTVGSILTGTVSGATARISADADSGATGTLTLRSIDGDFIDNEPLTDAAGGAADADGTLSGQAANLDTVGAVNLRSVYETDAGTACTFDANNNKLRLRVTGLSSEIWEWTCQVDLVIP